MCLIIAALFDAEVCGVNETQLLDIRVLWTTRRRSQYRTMECHYFIRTELILSPEVVYASAHYFNTVSSASLPTLSGFIVSNHCQPLKSN
jgi:hypothetical protein